MYIRISTGTARELTKYTLNEVGSAFNRFTHGSGEEMKNSLIQSNFPVDLQHAFSADIRRRYGTMTICIDFPFQHRVSTNALPKIAEDIFSWCIQELLPDVKLNCGLVVSVKQYQDRNLIIWREATKGAWHI